jgi:hypothetical protein
MYNTLFYTSFIRCFCINRYIRAPQSDIRQKLSPKRFGALRNDCLAPKVFFVFSFLRVWKYLYIYLMGKWVTNHIHDNTSQLSDGCFFSGDSFMCDSQSAYSQLLIFLWMSLNLKCEKNKSSF